MKDSIIWALLIAVIVFSGFLFVKIDGIQSKIDGLNAAVSSHDEKSKSWDTAVEILEDCMEYNTFGECKQRYPQYGEMFR